MDSDEFSHGSIPHLPDIPGENVDDIGNENQIMVEMNDNEDYIENGGCFKQKILETKLKVAESTVKTNKWNVMDSFDDAFGRELPQVLLTIHGKEPRLKTVETYEELNALCTAKKEIRNYDSECKFLNTPVNTITHYASFGDYFHDIYKSMDLADTIIKINESHFLTHRTILCCYSNYFEKLMLHKATEHVPIEIEILGISADAFENLLEFIYTGNIQIQQMYILDLFTIADVLGINALWKILTSIEDCQDLQQAVLLLVRHGQNCSGQLYGNLLTRVVNNFHLASRMNGFLDMDVELLCYFLQSDDLDVPSELDVFQIVLRWIVHGAHNRVRHCCQVMSLIRFQHMTMDEIYDCVNETTLFKENEELRTLILMSTWYVTALKLQRSDPFHIPIPTKRKGYRHKHVPLTPGSSMTQYQTYNEILNVNQSSLPNAIQLPKTHSPRCAKPVLIPAEDQVISRDTTFVPKKEQPSPTRYAKPVLIPQGHFVNMDISEVNSESSQHSSFSVKNVTWPPPKPVKEIVDGFKPPAKFAKTIWPPPKPEGELKPKPVIAALPFRAQRAFTNGKPPLENKAPQMSPPTYARPVMLPAQNSSPTPTVVRETYQKPPLENKAPQMSPPTYAKPVMIPTHNSSPTPPVVRETDPQQAPLPSPLEYMSRNEEHIADTNEQQQLHSQANTDPFSQFSTKVSAPKASTFCQHPDPPGKFAKPLMLPSVGVDIEKDGGKLCVSPSIEKTESQCSTDDGARPTTIEIFVIGGFCDNFHSDKGKEASSNNSKWMRYCNLPAPRKNFAVASISRKLYLIGGSDPIKGTITNTVFMMDFDSKIWRRLSSMSECRESHCACAIDNLVYVLGGLDSNHRPLCSVECYNVTDDVWYTVEDMMIPRFAATACSLDGKCYITGGLTIDGPGDKLKPLDIMECYDPQTYRWERKSNLRTAVCHSSLVNVEGCLYLCGGATVTFLDDNQVTLRSVADIDMYNEDDDTWEPVTDMMVPRHSAAVAVAGSRLVVIGGKNSTTERFLRSTEIFDTENIEWSTRSLDLPFPARSISCVVCPK